MSLQLQIKLPCTSDKQESAKNLENNFQETRCDNENSCPWAFKNKLLSNKENQNLP